MARARKKGSPGSGEFSLFEETEPADGDADEDLPRDEAGRAKIKHQYVDLLGIRVQKLAGRILNRERINKTLEGVYFVCVRCQKVCHNLDEGLVEDSENKANCCTPCSKLPAVDPAKAAQPKKAAQPRPEPAAAAAPARKKAAPPVKAKAAATPAPKKKPTSKK